MRQLCYQARVLDTLDAYLTELSSQKVEADKVEDLKQQNPSLPIPSVDPAKHTMNPGARDSNTRNKGRR